MQLNKQRLQLWLDGKVAAYNNGSSQDIAMIKELCKYSKNRPVYSPSGSAKFYAHNKITWYPFDTNDGMPHHPVSWLFEPEEPRYEIKSWVCDCGIWDNWNNTFVGRPIESEKIALEILKWYQSID